MCNARRETPMYEHAYLCAMALTLVLAQELPEEVEERGKWEEFGEAYADMKNECTFENMSFKIDGRQTVWNLIDELTTMHEVTLDAQQSRDVALADGPDGDAKADAYLRTKKGKKKLK